MKNEKVNIGGFNIDKKFVLPKNTKLTCQRLGCNHKAVYNHETNYYNSTKGRKVKWHRRLCLDHFVEYTKKMNKSNMKNKNNIDIRSEEIIKGLVPKYFLDLKIREEKARYVIIDLFQKSNLFCINEFVLGVNENQKNKNTFRADIYVPSLKLFIEAKRNSNTCTPSRYKAQMHLYRDVINKKFPISKIVSYDIDGSTNSDYNFLDFFKMLKAKVLKSKMVRCDKKVFEKEVNKIIKVLESRKDLFIYR